MSVAAKRKRSGSSQKSNKKTKISPAPRGPAVRGDALRWKAVTLPDRLDDAEGFYSLEELEDVEVVRDERNHVMFRPASSSDIADANQPSPDTVPNDDGEWEGFDDDENVTIERGETAPNGANGVHTEAAQLKNAPKSILKAPTGQLSQSEDDLDTENVFDLLDQLPVDSEVDVSAWSQLQLSDQMTTSISNLGFTKPTPIQAASIPPISDGKDVIGKAVTGSGKTLAFGIPILEKWLSTTRTPKSRNPTALVLAPTRELAHQLHDHLVALAEGFEEQPRIVKVTGGLAILKQQRQLENVDIIVATPGRLWEIINESQGLIDRLKQLKYLVIDEADRLLSEGHFKEVEDILDTLDREVLDENNRPLAARPKRQILVFSATFHKALHQKLAGKMKASSNLLSNQQSLSYLLSKLPFQKGTKPTFVDPSPTTTMSTHLTESILQCPAMEKDLYLYALLLLNHRLKTLIFTNSISTVKRLTPLLSTLAQPAHALHSSMPQKSRLRSLERFHANKHSLLVATDVAARGLDIKGIDLIIHYHVPRTADMYVHRSGRTARAEASGKSILLCSPDEVVPVSRLIGKVHGGESGEAKAPETTHVEREVIKRVRSRVELAKKIVEAEQAKEKSGSRDDWVKAAAEELGVDYDSEEFEEVGKRMKRGRGGGRDKKAKENAEVGKEKIAAWRAELKEALAKRVNMGVSERYIAGGAVDMEALIEGKGSGVFLEGR